MLFTCIGGPGRLNTLLPISLAVADAGHTVLWATSASLSGLIKNAEFSFRQLGSRPAARPRKRAPLWVADAKQSDEKVRREARYRAHGPVIYFTLGTEFGKESGDLYERVLTGLRALPVNPVMTVGWQIDRTSSAAAGTYAYRAVRRPGRGAAVLRCGRTTWL